MDIKVIKEWAQTYTQAQLETFITELENTGTCGASGAKNDPSECMSDLLQASEVRRYLDQGMPLQEAVREFSKRVRGVLTKR